MDELWTHLATGTEARVIFGQEPDGKYFWYLWLTTMPAFHQKVFDHPSRGGFLTLPSARQSAFDAWSAFCGARMAQVSAEREAMPREARHAETDRFDVTLYVEWDGGWKWRADYWWPGARRARLPAYSTLRFADYSDALAAGNAWWNAFFSANGVEDGSLVSEAPASVAG